MNKIRYMLSQIKEDKIIEKEYTKKEILLGESEANKLNLSLISYLKVKRRLDLIEIEKKKFSSSHIEENLIDIYEFAINNSKYILNKKPYVIINPNGENYIFNPLV